MPRITRKPTPYWTKVIDGAYARVLRGLPAFTVGQTLRARSWVTCACGKQDKRIPKRADLGSGFPIPKDCTLTNLGIEFMTAIRDRKIKLARTTLAKIEHRSAEILHEMGYN